MKIKTIISKGLRYRVVNNDFNCFSIGDTVSWTGERMSSIFAFKDSNGQEQGLLLSHVEQVQERPILFSSPMVNAILSSRKSMTRRVVKDADKCEYGKVGDILWVRETFAEIGDKVIYKATDNIKTKWKPCIFMPKLYSRIWLEIISIRKEKLENISDSDAIAEGIEFYSDGDETLYCDYVNKVNYNSPYLSFRSLWVKINGLESWDKNPEVWVIEFKRIEKPRYDE